MHSNTTGTTELQRQSAAYASVRKRLLRPANAFRAPAPLPAPEPIRPKPRKPIQQNDHVLRWQWHLASQHSPAGHIARRSAELDVPIEEVKSRCRIAKVTKAKQLIIWEVHTIWPGLSLKAIGRLFGGLDHTSVLAALRKYGHETKAPRRFTKAEIRKMQTLHAAGATNADIAKVLGCHTDSVRRYTDEDCIQKRKAADAAKRATRKVRERRQAAKARAA